MPPLLLLQLLLLLFPLSLFFAVVVRAVVVVAAAPVVVVAAVGAVLGNSRTSSFRRTLHLSDGRSDEKLLQDRGPRERTRAPKFPHARA